MTQQPRETPPSDETLQHYFDGLLAEAEVEPFEERLKHLPAERAKLDAMAQIREQLRAAAAAEVLDAESLFRGIQSRLAKDAKETQPEMLSATPPLALLQGGAERVGDEHPAPKAKAKIYSMWWPVAGMGVAAAVLLSFLVGPLRPATWSYAPSQGEGEQLTMPIGSEVMEADFGDRTGTVFDVEDEVGDRILVVWIDDNEVDEDPQEQAVEELGDEEEDSDEVVVQ